MPERNPIANDPSQALVFNFVGQSPHVFAYKVWLKRPGEEWESCDCCEGDTVDDVPDHCDLGPLPDGTLLDIPVATGGHKNSTFKAQIVFTQGGALTPGGILEVKGRTSDQGGGAAYKKGVLV